jgi:hypothetical protein
MKLNYFLLFLLFSIVAKNSPAQDTLTVQGFISHIDSINTQHGGYLLLLTVDTCNCTHDFLVVRAKNIPENRWKLQDFEIFVHENYPTKPMMKLENLLNECCPPIEPNNMREHPRRIYWLIE